MTKTTDEKAAGPPAPKTILLTWALLMALTIGTMLAGKVTSAASLGIAWTAVLLAITWAKTRGILLVYLNLRAAPAHWRSGFGTAIAFLLLLLLAIYAFGFFGLVPKAP
jgi:hypothetical protein